MLMDDIWPWDSQESFLYINIYIYIYDAYIHTSFRRNSDAK